MGLSAQPLVNQNPQATLDLLRQLRTLLPQFEQDVSMLTQDDPALAGDEVVISFMIRNALERNEDLLRWIRAGANSPGVRDFDRLFNDMALFTANEDYLARERPESASTEAKQALVRLGVDRLNLLAKTLKLAEVDEPPRHKAHFLGLLLWALVDFVDRNVNLVGLEIEVSAKGDAGQAVSQASSGVGDAERQERRLDAIVDQGSFQDQSDREDIVGQGERLRNALQEAVGRAENAKDQLTRAAAQSGRFGDVRGALDSVEQSLQEVKEAIDRFDRQRGEAEGDADTAEGLVESLKEAVDSLDTGVGGLKDVLQTIEDDQ